MSRDDQPETRLDDAVRGRLERVLAEHPISFAMLFGSAGRKTMSETSDLALAVEFESHRPSDDGYSQVYLRLTSAVDDTVSRSVGVVDIHSMSPAFARAAFDHGEVLVGSEAQRKRLERELAGEASTVADAHERVAAAANRLREGQQDDSGGRASSPGCRCHPVMRCRPTERTGSRMPSVMSNN